MPDLTPDDGVLSLPAASNTMKISLPHLLLGFCCALTLLFGCMPMAGPGRYPIGYPGQPGSYYPPQPYPGGPPGYHVGYPPFPGGPGVPIVMNPTPPSDTVPTQPSPNPDTPPTIPVGDPKPIPPEPDDDSTAFWSPWPLPPQGNQSATLTVGFSGRTGPIAQNNVRQNQLAAGASAAPSEDLRYRGGRIIQNLSYVNLYVSGDTEWLEADVERIDGSLSAAMNDRHLNNVLLQYYNNHPISSRALPSHPLIGYTPESVTRGDIQNYATHLYEQGFLDPYDPQNTVFNFLLPPGTILTTDARSTSAVREDENTFGVQETGSDDEVSDSLGGMAGYHGSVVTADGGRIYFAVGVYSERAADGSTNGIPVFNEPWKNVAATLYHQLIETRTDPDVEDALRDSSDLNSDHILGWVSDSGLEIGDFPINSDIPLTSVIREVPLADGSGYVPVQLPYSNFVHGPEGPIAQPHPLR